MTILVTRPSPAGEQLVNRLQALGLAAYHFPLIEFTPGRQLNELPQHFAHLADGALVIVLSQHVIQYANAVLSQTTRKWPIEYTWFAIGRTTALQLHATSHRHVHYPQGRETSEALLQLPELQQIAGKDVVILRGNGGRELLGDTLKQRGATVRYCECYQRVQKHYNGAEEAYRWYQRKVSTLVVTSGEMLHQLYQLMPDWYQKNWLLHCQLVVVSERLAIQASELGWQNIRIADNADNDALLRALHSNYNTGRHNDGSRQERPHSG